LVVEVADATLSQDRASKKRLYASARIPVYWIVNLLENQIEVYTDPSGPADEPDYRQRQDYGPADTLPVVIEGRELGRVAVRELLP
jgi:Uma2 family endonuclease